MAFGAAQFWLENILYLLPCAAALSCARQLLGLAESTTLHFPSLLTGLTMFYQKNLPMWERMLRVCMGLLLAAAGWYGGLQTMAMWAAIGGGVMFAGTGFFGFCPMCAMVGRKPSK